jgi:hypothetical protein
MKGTNRRRAPGRLLVLAIGAFALPAAAFQPLVTDDTGTQGERGNQVEFSIDTDRTKEAGETTRTRTLPLTYTRGLSDALDVFAGISHVRIRSSSPGADASGSGNPVLGAKWRFFESESSKTSLGLKPEILLPVSHARETIGLGNGRTSWALTFIVTQEVAFGAIHANLATARNRFRDPLAPISTATAVSIAPVWDVAPGWKLALDLGYEAESAGGVKTRTRFAELGAIYSPSENLDFALGVIRSTNSADPRLTTNSATLGVTWRFK